MYLIIISIILSWVTLIEEEAIFPNVNGSYYCKCRLDSKKGINKNSFLVNLNYGNKNTIISKKEYKIFSSNAFYGVNAIRKEGNLMFFLHGGTESKFIDFQAKIGDSWQLNEGIYKGYKVTFISKSQSKDSTDSVYVFELTSMSTKVSHTPYLKSFEVSKKNGFVGFKYDMDGVPYFNCRNIKKKRLE